MSSTVAGEAGLESLLQGYRDHVSVGRARLAQFMSTRAEVRSEGCFVYDETGRPHLDCGGYGVFILGHCHPRVVAAVRDQLERHPLGTRQLVEPRQVEAAEALARVAPEGLEYALFTAGGAEAVEAALKIARLNGADVTIATEGGFHGKTFGALSVTGRAEYRDPFEPLVPNVERIPYGDAAALAEALDRHPAGACSVILEPIQGEGGVVIPARGYLSEVKSVCERSRALLILDEIQTGLGRVGEWWAADREGVVPDILLTGKGLSGGVVPVSAVVSTPEVFDPLSRDPLLHTTTFGGAPIAMAAAAAALATIEEENVVERAAALGDRLLAETKLALAGHSDIVADIRGVGLLIGIEFHSPHLAGDFMAELVRRRVIVSHSLNTNHVVRLTPPVSLEDEHIDWLTWAMDESATVVAQRYGSLAPTGGPTCAA